MKKINKSLPCRVALAAASLMFLLAATPQPSRADSHGYKEAELEDRRWGEPHGDWVLSVGGGVFVGTRHEGSDSYGVSPAPFISLSYKGMVEISPAGVSVLYEGENYGVGFNIGYDLGRDEDDDKGALAGLGDVKVGGLIGATIVYEVLLPVSMEVSHGLGGHNGTLITFGTDLPIPIAENAFIAVGLSFTWASDNYMEAYYGITDIQARRSLGLYDPDRDVFAAGAGVKDFSLSLGLAYLITENLGLRAEFDYMRLLNDAEDSPVVRNNGDKNQYGGGVFLEYRFHW